MPPLKYNKELSPLIVNGLNATVYLYNYNDLPSWAVEGLSSLKSDSFKVFLASVKSHSSEASLASRLMAIIQTLHHPDTTT